MKISEQWFEIFSTEDMFTKEEAYRRAVKQNPSLIEATFIGYFLRNISIRKRWEKWVLMKKEEMFIGAPLPPNKTTLHTFSASLP